MKVFIAGLTIAAAIVGGGIGYASLQTGIAPPIWERDKSSAQTNSERESSASEDGSKPSASSANTSSPASVNQPPVSQSPVSQPPDRQSNQTRNRQTDRPSRSTIPAGADDIVISEEELNQRIQAALSSDPTIAPLLEITEDGVNTIITNDRIESGITMNLTELPLEDLPLEAQTAVSELIKTFPFLANRPVYLGIEGSPKIVDGAVSLDETNLKFGPLKLPVSGVASQLGVSQTDIEQQLNIILEQQGLTPDEIQIADKQIVIKGI